MEVMNTAQVDYKTMNRILKGITDHDIEGTVLQKEDGTWFIPVVFSDGRVSTVQVDYCPWCGESLVRSPDYDHKC